MRKNIALAFILVFAAVGCAFASEGTAAAPGAANFLQWLNMGPQSCSTATGLVAEDPGGDPWPDLCMPSCSGEGCIGSWCDCECIDTGDPRCPQPQWVCP